MAHEVTVPTPSQNGGSQRLYAQPAVARPLRDLFERMPDLAGFRVRSDLMVADVTAVGCPASARSRRLHVSVMRALVELAECNPEAISIMRGHAFARTQP